MAAVLAATSIMQLHERRLLDIDEPAAAYVPTWPSAGRLRWVATLRHVLVATAGLLDPPDLSVKWAQGGGPWLSDRAEAELARHGRLRWEAGAVQEPSELGSLLLASVVEQRSGRRFHQYVEENIFAPLGMANTTIGPEGVKGPIEDLARFAAALAAGGQGRTGAVLEEDTVRQMFAAQRRPGGWPWTHGIAWTRDPLRGEPCVIHRDDQAGQAIFIRICPASGRWVAVLAAASAHWAARLGDGALPQGDVVLPRGTALTKGP